MIFELTKTLKLIGGDYVLRDENLISFCNIDFIKGGIILTNEKGQLISQLLIGKNNVTVTIADGPSITVNENYEIKQIELNEEENNFITDMSVKRNEESEYFFFGNPSNFRYDLYVKEKNSLKPLLGCEVIPHPWKEDTFKVRIQDNLNQLKILSICLAFTLIATNTK